VLVMHDLAAWRRSAIAEILDTNILTVRTAAVLTARRELEALAANDPALAEFLAAPANGTNGAWSAHLIAKSSSKRRVTTLT